MSARSVERPAAAPATGPSRKQGAPNHQGLGTTRGSPATNVPATRAGPPSPIRWTGARFARMPAGERRAWTATSTTSTSASRTSSAAARSTRRRSRRSAGTLGLRRRIPPVAPKSASGGAQGTQFAIHTPTSDPGQDTVTTGMHLAFRAESREAVHAFHAAAVAAGGRDIGAPGPRAGVQRGVLRRVRARSRREQRRGRLARPRRLAGAASVARRSRPEGRAQPSRSTIPGYRRASSIPCCGEPEQRHAGRDARAAVGDDRARVVQEPVRERRGGGRAARPGNVAGDRIDRLVLAAEALGRARVDDQRHVGRPSRPGPPRGRRGRRSRDAITSRSPGDDRGRRRRRARPCQVASPPSSTATSRLPMWRSSHHRRAAPPLMSWS